MVGDPEEFPILIVDPATVEDIEEMGSKPKVWFRLNDERWLFKEARASTAEHVAEKFAAEIAHHLDIVAPDVELAQLEGRAGCACRSFIEDRNKEFLIHGNELLAGLVVGYDKTKMRKQSDHTLANIIAVLEQVFPAGRPREAAAARLAGYVMLDALIANVDRHHENWGLLLKAAKGEKFTVEVAPSFDHASSLGRELTDQAREELMREHRVLSYVTKGKGGIYAEAAAGRGCSPLELAAKVSERFEPFLLPWRKRLANFDDKMLDILAQKVPLSFASRAATAFMVQLVLETKRVLLESLV